MTTVNETTTGAQESQSYNICSDLMLKVLMGSKMTDEDSVHLIQVLFFVLLSEKYIGEVNFLSLMLTASAKTDQYLEIMEHEIKAVVEEQEKDNAA
ncbi:MAG: hypothetical protein ACM3QX_18445 [Syntrophomonadaceae bacterium]